MTNTNAAKIRVTTVSGPKGDTEVHGPGCADLKKKNRNRDDAYTWTVGSAVELSWEFWNDQISDQADPDSPEGWAIAEEWIGTFHFLPCAPKFPAAEAKPAKAQTPAAGEPHAFSAKGSAKPSACVTCGRTWNAAAHRKFRAAA